MNICSSTLITTDTEMSLIKEIKDEIMERTKDLDTEDFMEFMQELAIWSEDKLAAIEFAAEMREEDNER